MISREDTIRCLTVLEDVFCEPLNRVAALFEEYGFPEDIDELFAFAIKWLARGIEPPITKERWLHKIKIFGAPYLDTPKLLREIPGLTKYICKRRLLKRGDSRFRIILPRLPRRSQLLWSL